MLDSLTFALCALYPETRDGGHFYSSYYLSVLTKKKIIKKHDNFQIHGTGALVISAMLDFLTFALCAPYSETTDGGHFDSLLETVAANGRIIFKLFQVSKESTLTL